MTAATAAVIGLATTAVSTGVGIVSSIAQANAQQEYADQQAAIARQQAAIQQAQYQQEQANAEYQAKLAERNANIASANQQIAENQASSIRKEGYDAMVAKNQETSTLIGKQRAAAAASGAAVDIGSLADVNQDTAAKGAIDSVNLYNKALDEAYTKDIEAWNYGNQSTAYKQQAGSYTTQANYISKMAQMNADIPIATADYTTSGYLNAAASGLSGIASGMNNYANWSLKNGQTNSLASSSTNNNKWIQVY